MELPMLLSMQKTPLMYTKGRRFTDCWKNEVLAICQDQGCRLRPKPLTQKRIWRGKHIVLSN